MREKILISQDVNETERNILARFDERFILNKSENNDAGIANNSYVPLPENNVVSADDELPVV